jgi:hypothetical protein
VEIIELKGKKYKTVDCKFLSAFANYAGILPTDVEYLSLEVGKMAKQKLYNPGQRAPDSGQYKIVGSRGGETDHGERTVVKGKPLPPTPEPGLKYIEVDPTKHKK